MLMSELVDLQRPDPTVAALGLSPEWAGATGVMWIISVLRSQFYDLELLRHL
jgi:hypothetical protein